MENYETGEFIKDNIINYQRIVPVIELPDLVGLQKDSYNWFVEKGMKEVFDEINPIEDYSGNLVLEFLDYSLGEPPHNILECRERDLTYSRPLKIKVRLITKENGEIKEIKEQDIFMGDFPYMTPQGTFVVNGAERAVVTQLVRSPGIYYQSSPSPTGRKTYFAQIIPNRGTWLEFESDLKDSIIAKIDRTKKIPLITLLRALGFTSDEELLELFNQHPIIQNLIHKETTKDQDEALIDIYRKVRPGDPPSADSSRTLLQNLFFEVRRYNLAKVGRYKLNKKLGMKLRCDNCGCYSIPGTINCPDCGKEIDYSLILGKDDLVAVIRYLLALMDGKTELQPYDDKFIYAMVQEDDIDHLGNRRIRPVGELLQNQFRVGLIRLERVVRERMTVQDVETVTPQTLINIRPVVAAIKEFFGSSQLSQFMDQTNPLAELTHKRRVSALGPGGLSRERAGFEVRDVHNSHYGRICPIETPEGPNIGLIGSLASYTKVNDFGFLITPYRKVHKGYVTDEIVYLSADEEDFYVIAQANTLLDENSWIIDDKVPARDHHEPTMVNRADVEFMDIVPAQVVSVATSLIPFLEHDDANRALMGANMQRQAVPIIQPDIPTVGTGIEGRSAKDSGALLLSLEEGTVSQSTASEIVVTNSKGKKVSHKLLNYARSNAGTCINQKPMAKKGALVNVGDVLADGPSSLNGKLSLGRNVLVAFMPWEGYNYEDAILLSEELVKDDFFTSIHIEKYECEARDTKLGPEEITRDIPNVGEEALKNLDENGIIRIGAQVRSEDILAGKVTPKGETELTAEERLLRAIFGEKAKDVRDTSLKVPHGEKGKVIDVKLFSRETEDALSPGVNKFVRVHVAQKRKIMQGDKMAGRHGNKGVIAKILPEADMPFLPDGTPVQIVLNPLGVPSRMNIGQIMECHIGGAARSLGLKIVTPVFDGATEKQVKELMKIAHLRKVMAQENLEFRADELKYLISPLSQNDKLKLYLKTQGIILTDIQIKDLIKSEDLLKELSKLFKDHKVKLEKTELLKVLEEQDLEGRLRKLLKAKEVEKSDGEIRRLVRYVEKFMELPEDGKSGLLDGRTGEPFEARVTVGEIYMLKLAHLVDDKIHARSTGPYSLITQQPLGGKAQFGGQRFGEMEVWALEAYGAAYTLQEFLTVKSDDVVGRVKTYEAIVKGENIIEPGVPESFKVLVKELQSLALDVQILSEDPQGKLKLVELKGSDEQDVNTAARELGLDLSEAAIKSK